MARARTGTLLPAGADGFWRARFTVDRPDGTTSRPVYSLGTTDKALASDDYFHGYQRGLRRLYHGARFGTAEEHARWSALGTGDDPRVELGRGYRDGFAGAEVTS